MDLAAATDQLYGLAPTEFVAARAALVSEARAAGDAPLAASIGKLRKPTVGAWLSNVLARREAAQLDQLVELGSMLRDAQDTLDGAQLRDLGRQRGQLVAALAGLARRHAAELGHPVSESAAREVEATLTAALSDPEAAEQVLGGSLVTSLEYVGGGFGVASDGPAVRARRAAATPQPRPTPVGKVTLHAVRAAPPDEDAQELDQAERALAQARLRAADAAEGVEAARHERASADRAAAAAQAREESIVAELAALQEQRALAVESVRQAKVRVDVADRAGRAADRAVAQAADLVVAAERVLAELRDTNG